MEISSPEVQATHELVADLDRLGDEIAELSAPLDAATAQLLDLIREFDARGGWNTGFLSCAAWLTWRGQAHPGAAGQAVGRAPRARPPLPAASEPPARAAPGMEPRAGRRSGGNAHDGPAAGRRAGLARRDGPAPRDRSRCAGRAVPGRRPCRRAGAGRAGGAWAVRPRGGDARFRGNVPAPGVRREPGDDAAHCGWPGRGGRRPDPHHSSRVTTRAPSPRSGLSLPRLRPPVRPGASHPPLGPRRADHALEPGAALSPPPSRGARGGLSDGATAPRRAQIPTTGPPAPA